MSDPHRHWDGALKSFFKPFKEVVADARRNEIKPVRELSGFAEQFAEAMDNYGLRMVWEFNATDGRPSSRKGVEDGIRARAEIIGAYVIGGTTKCDMNLKLFSKEILADKQYEIEEWIHDGRPTR